MVATSMENLRVTAELQLNVREKSQCQPRGRNKLGMFQNRMVSTVAVVWRVAGKVGRQEAQASQFILRSSDLTLWSVAGDGVTLGRGGTESSTHPRSCFSFLIVHPVLFLLSHTDYRCYLYLYRLVSVTFFQPDPFVLIPLTTETENNRLYHLSLPLNVRNISEDMHSQPFTKWGLLLSFAEF